MIALTDSVDIGTSFTLLYLKEAAMTVRVMTPLELTLNTILDAGSAAAIRSACDTPAAWRCR